MSDQPVAKPQGWNTKPIPAKPLKTGVKVSLRVDQFDDLVEKQGVRVKVYRSSYCPRVKSIDGAEHEIDCPLCYGRQFIDRFCLETVAFIQTQELEKKVQAEGLVDGNSVAATFKQNVELQYFTLVELLDFTDIYFQRIKRQKGSVDVLKYPGLRINMLVDQDGKDYFESSDFKIDVNGCIEWCPNKGPRAGKIYTIHYETAVRFRAVRAMHSNRFAQITKNGGTNYIKMNEQWMLQKEFLVVRKDIDGKVLKPNKIADADEEAAPGDRPGDWGFGR